MSAGKWGGPSIGPGGAPALQGQCGGWGAVE